MLNATTTTYLDLIGNGKRYRVPPYQRDHSWTEEEWEDLWNDIVDLHREPDSRHYMGTVVVQAETDREFLVIDGQQRLATIGIFTLAVIRKLHRMAEQGVDPNTLEPPVYHEAAKAVLDGRAGRPRAIFECLRPIYVDDDRFRDDFARLSVQTRGQRRKLAKYALCRLEADARAGACDHETDPATIEHILPQNPSTDWTGDFPPRQHESAVDRLAT